jgi:glycosyltransferase involved in cell wall biosynthesis
MRIAQIAPLAEAVPPKLYGGTERMVSWLTEELVRQGHDVHLFASGDSRTSATLHPAVPKALRLSGVRDHIPSTLVMLDEVRRRASEFDILHFHIDMLQYPLFQHLFHKSVTTLHGRLDLPDFHPIYRAFPEMPLVSISHNQRTPMPPVNWISTIHHGLPQHLYKPRTKPGTYLAFLGRISPEKRPDRAIEIAKRSGIPLKIAAKIDAVDEVYYNAHIKPLMNDPLVEFIGEIDDTYKEAFLGEALALLFPIDWAEPFGLVMIEAMAVGTPVIARRNGSVPEIIEHGTTGAIVDSVDQALEAIMNIHQLDRRVVRSRYENRFTASNMAKRYIAAFQEVIRNTRNTPCKEALGPVTPIPAPPLQTALHETPRLTPA